MAPLIPLTIAIARATNLAPQNAPFEISQPFLQRMNFGRQGRAPFYAALRWTQVIWLIETRIGEGFQDPSGRIPMSLCLSSVIRWYAERRASV